MGDPDSAGGPENRVERGRHATGGTRTFDGAVILDMNIRTPLETTINR